MKARHLLILFSLLIIAACSDDARHFSENRVYQSVPDSCMGTGCVQEISFRASGAALMTFGSFVESGDYGIIGTELSVEIVGGFSFSGDFTLSEDEETMTHIANGVLWTRIE